MYNFFNIKHKFSEICTLPFIKGPCDYNLQNQYFYFDNLTATCRLFTYGGCGGNKNRFKTEKECQNTWLFFYYINKLNFYNIVTNYIKHKK